MPGLSQLVRPLPFVSVSNPQALFTSSLLEYSGGSRRQLRCRSYRHILVVPRAQNHIVASIRRGLEMGPRIGLRGLLGFSQPFRLLREFYKSRRYIEWIGRSLGVLEIVSHAQTSGVGSGRFPTIVQQSSSQLLAKVAINRQAPNSYTTHRCHCRREDSVLSLSRVGDVEERKKWGSPRWRIPISKGAMRCQAYR